MDSLYINCRWFWHRNTNYFYSFDSSSRLGLKFYKWISKLNSGMHNFPYHQRTRSESVVLVIEDVYILLFRTCSQSTFEYLVRRLIKYSVQLYSCPVEGSRVTMHNASWYSCLFLCIQLWFVQSRDELLWLHMIMDLTSIVYRLYKLTYNCNKQVFYLININTGVPVPNSVKSWSIGLDLL